MSNLKRLRDTDNKKIVRAIPTAEPYKKLQVWTNDDGSKLYVYRNSQYLELNTETSTVAEYGHVRKQLTDETVGYYLTPEPVNLYHWDHGDDAYYEFVDYDGTVLKSGTVIEGGTPTAPADPTRAGYTFTGWEPTVGPITKRTTYTATYTLIPTYTLSFESSIEGAGYFTDKNGNTITSLTVEEGTGIWGYAVISGKPLYFGEISGITSEYVVRPHANAGYNFVKWTCNGEDVPQISIGQQEPIGTVESNMTYVAVFEPIISTVTIQSNNTSYGTVSPTTVSDVAYGTTVTVSSNTITIGETTITATPETGCSFVDWSDVPSTITGNTTITANFQSDTPTPTTATITLSVSGDSASWVDLEMQPQSSITVDINTVMTVEGVDESSIGVTWNEQESAILFMPSDGAVTAFKVDGVAKTTGDTITITGDTTFLAECAS